MCVQGRVDEIVRNSGLHDHMGVIMHRLWDTKHGDARGMSRVVWQAFHLVDVLNGSSLVMHGRWVQQMFVYRRVGNEPRLTYFYMSFNVFWVQPKYWVLRPRTVFISNNNSDRPRPHPLINEHL